MHRIALILAVVALVAIGGCGGGGGDGAASNTTRQLVVGNQVIYSITGTGDNGASSGPITGTATITVYSDTATPKYGNRSLRFVWEINIQFQGHTYADNVTVYYEQGANGAIYQAGYEGARLVTSTAAPVYFPSPISAGATYSYVITYSGDPAPEQNDVNVMQKETVAGYESYRVHRTWTMNSYSGAGDDWLVPDLGLPVKSTLDGDIDDVTVTGTMVLASKNF